MPESQDWESVMRGRRTVRRFSRQTVERGQVEELIELATTAPSASNNQPWRFFVSDQRSLIESMAQAVQEEVDKVKSEMALSSRPAFEAYGDYFTRFAAAPVVIVPAYRPLSLLSQMVSPDPLIERLEEVSGLASTSLAVQNLLLAAHARGLGASCMSGPLLAAPRIETLLGIPQGWRMGMLIALGYAAEEPVAPPRKGLKTVLRWVDRAPQP